MKICTRYGNSANRYVILGSPHGLTWNPVVIIYIYIYISTHIDIYIDDDDDDDDDDDFEQHELFSQ